MYECDYCLKQIDHGGECQGKQQTQSCLLFQRDIRGKQAQMRVLLPIPFGNDIPNYIDQIKLVISGIDKTVQLLRIHHVDWLENGKGLAGVELDITISYWTEENGVLPKIVDRPQLKLIKY